MTTETYQTTGSVAHGQIYLDAPRTVRLALTDFPDGPMIVTFESTTAAAVRTLQANKFQWVIFTIIADASGHTKDEIHDLCCQMFLSYDLETIDPQTGECHSVRVTRGTSKLKPGEHGEFLDRVMAWAGPFFGVEFPDREAA